MAHFYFKGNKIFVMRANFEYKNWHILSFYIQIKFKTFYFYSGNSIKKGHQDDSSPMDH